MNVDRDAPTLGTMLREARARLAAAGLAEAEADARLLLADLAGLGPLDLILQAGKPLPAAMAAAYRARLGRRLAGEPVGRIIGRRDFWGLSFTLSPATLEPRADSEALILEALAQLGERRREPLRVLDLGVGTGCLLIALLSECPHASGVGIDASAEAVATAAGNAARLGVGDRATFRVGDWYAGLSERFDLIISNPPYIESAAIAGLDREVRAHDPRLALDGGVDGLSAYRPILDGAGAHLNTGGVVILELGAGQREAVEALARERGFAQVGLRADLGGHPRALALRRGGEAAVHGEG